MKRKSLLLLATVSILCLLTTGTALAVVSFTVYENPAAMLRAFFGENGGTHSDGVVEYSVDGQLAVSLPGWNRVPVDETLAEALITPYISAETGSVSWGGYTLTVEANLYDPLTESGLLYYTVENPEGVGGYGVEANGMFGWYAEAGQIRVYSDQAGETYMDAAMSTGTKVYLCEYYIRADIPDAMPVLNLFLCEQAADPESAYTGAGQGVKSEIRGTLSVGMENGGAIPTLSLRGGHVRVSPISIRIHEAELGFDTASYIHRIVLRYEDGSEYILLDSHAFIDNRMYALGQYGQSAQSGSISESTRAGQGDLPGPQGMDANALLGYRTTHIFNRIVDINRLSEIVLDEMVIALD
ncbi:MAG: hypothetical protein FWG93_05060 [Oscillospiraceae bacterium]|nr:hypothetical protein [Oscillospiraceae bacterium]